MMQPLANEEVPTEDGQGVARAPLARMQQVRKERVSGGTGCPLSEWEAARAQTNAAVAIGRDDDGDPIGALLVQATWVVGWD